MSFSDEPDLEMLGRRLMEDAEFVAKVTTARNRLTAEMPWMDVVSAQGLAMRLVRDLYPDEEYLAEVERRTTQERALATSFGRPSIWPFAVTP